MAEPEPRDGCLIHLRDKKSPRPRPRAFQLGEKVGIRRCPNPYFTALTAAPLAERAVRTSATMLGATFVKRLESIEFM